VNLNQELDTALQQAQRLELPTAMGKQVWHVWNQAAGNPLVLLHGGSGSWNHWVRNVLPLSQHRAVWALDTPGQGDSDLPPNAEDADDLAQPLAQGLEVLFQQQAIDLVGFSFGGLMAGFLAAQQPARIKRMVLVGVPGFGLFNGIKTMRGFKAGMATQERMEIHRNNLLAIMLHDENTSAPNCCSCKNTMCCATDCVKGVLPAAMPCLLCKKNGLARCMAFGVSAMLCTKVLCI